MASEDNKKTFNGGCHCGQVKYTLRLDPANLTANRCNCTFCQKLGQTNYHTQDPSADFALVTPADPSTLGNYQARTPTVNRYFCQSCGVHIWMQGSFEVHGQTFPLFVVNLRTVDQPQGDLDLSKTKIMYYDLLHDNWGGGLKEQPWPCGLP